MNKPIKLLPILPAERALKVISGRWKAIVLYHLLGGTKRLSELKRLMPGTSQKVLIQQLREMEEHGLVHREVFKQVPPRVDYSATRLGRSLEPVLSSLCAWGRRHAVALDEIDRLAECFEQPESPRRGSSRLRAGAPAASERRPAGLGQGRRASAEARLRSRPASVAGRD